MPRKRKISIFSEPRPTPAAAPVEDTSNKELGNEVLSWWWEARTFNAANRELMHRDSLYYAGEQWTPDEIRELEARGQIPAVYNLIQVNVNWVSGTERRSTIDFHVLPRTSDDVEAASTKTKLLKHVSDYSQFNWHRSRAFHEAIVAGLSFLEVGVRNDSRELPIFLRHESWRNVWHDPLSFEMDLSDARYLIRSKVVALETAKAMFPEFGGVIESAADTADRAQFANDGSSSFYGDGSSVTPLPFDFGDPFQYRRTRAVRLLECWYRKPENVRRITGRYRGLYDPNNPRHQQAVAMGDCSIYDAVVQRVHCAIVTAQGDVLYSAPSPYAHDAFPFVPVWCYRRDDNGLPFGAVRNMISPQQSLNKRKAKSLFLLSTNRVVADINAVEDPELFEREAARPDAIIWKRPGTSIAFETALPLADSHNAFAQADALFLKEISGVTTENLGQSQLELSGRAINLRQQQGSVATASLMDNLRLATQHVGERLLSLVESVYTEPTVIRIAGERQQNEFLSLNQLLPDGRVLNDVAASSADFKVAEVDYRESDRQATFEMLLNTVGRLDPTMATGMLDLVFETSDLPAARQIAERIRRLNGQPDPADPQAARDEAVRAERKAARDEEDRRVALARETAELRELLARTHKLLAETDLARAKADELAQPGVQYRVTTPALR